MPRRTRRGGPVTTTTNTAAANYTYMANHAPNPRAAAFWRRQAKAALRRGGPVNPLETK